MSIFSTQKKKKIQTQKKKTQKDFISFAKQRLRCFRSFIACASEKVRILWCPLLIKILCFCFVLTWRNVGHNASLYCFLCKWHHHQNRTRKHCPFHHLLQPSGFRPFLWGWAKSTKMGRVALKKKSSANRSGRIGSRFSIHDSFSPFSVLSGADMENRKSILPNVSFNIMSPP